MLTAGTDNQLYTVVSAIVPKGLSSSYLNQTRGNKLSNTWTFNGYCIEGKPNCTSLIQPKRYAICNLDFVYQNIYIDLPFVAVTAHHHSVVICYKINCWNDIKAKSDRIAILNYSYTKWHVYLLLYTYFYTYICYTQTYERCFWTDNFENAKITFRIVIINRKLIKQPKKLINNNTHVYSHTNS